MKHIKLFGVLIFLMVAISVSPQHKKTQQKKKPTNKSIDVQVQTSVTDIDGNVYKTVKIGKQIWMAENLKVTHYRNGDEIINIKDTTSWKTSYSACCDYNNDVSNSVIYGKLYNWFAVVDNRNIAPKGWHVATHDEWTILTDYLGGEDNAGGKLKETGFLHWKDPNKGATNEIGFCALPGGYRSNDGDKYMTRTGWWWCSSEADDTNAVYILIFDDQNFVLKYAMNKQAGMSVRCVKDSN
jgi:uncharacterized protein (TIGR02145 family)